MNKLVFFVFLVLSLPTASCIKQEFNTQEHNITISDIIYQHPCIVSFIDDDSGIYVPDIWSPIIEETGIRMGFAVVAGYMAGAIIPGGPNYQDVLAPMPKSVLTALYDDGHEVYSHSWSHPDFFNLETIYPTTYLDVLEDECRKSRDWLNANGFTRNSDIIVYPGGMGTTGAVVEKKFDIIRRNYRYGVGTLKGGINAEPLTNDLYISRCNADRMTLEELKKRFDEALEENKLLVLMNHAYELMGFEGTTASSTNKDENVQKLIDFIQYIQSTNAIILPLGEALHQIYGWH